ncbi:MAG: hypothetical protein ACXAD7_24645, partial [Candidatus Kariarchaeaceae archaeon]
MDRAIAMFTEGDGPYSEETKSAFIKEFRKSWLTRQYFSKGQHDLVLPAWVLGILGPTGEGRHGISGAPILKNTDLRSYYALGSPDSEDEPVVDHRGGVIPIPGSYTIIFGTQINERPFYSSEIGEISVELHDDGFPIVSVFWEVDGDTMVYDAFSDRDEDGNEALSITVARGFANHPLFVCLTPMDQDGITSIPSIMYDSKEQYLTVSEHPPISISEPPIRVVTLPINQGHA